MERITFTQLSEQELREIIREELANFFKEYSGLAKGKDGPQIVGIDGLLEARPFIGSKATIYKKTSSLEIPHYKSGRQLLFDLQQVDEWLLSNKVKTMKEIDQEANEYIANRRRK